MIWLKVVIPAHYEPASILFIWLVKVDFEKNISLIGNLKKNQFYRQNKVRCI